LFKNKDAFDISFIKKLSSFESLLVNLRHTASLLLCILLVGCHSSPEPKKQTWQPPTTPVSSTSDDNDAECKTRDVCLEKARLALRRKDTTRMLHFLGRTCELDVDYCGPYASELMETGDFVAARQVLQKLCVQENHAGACGLAGRYFATIEPFDAELGERYMQRGCDYGEITACYNLAVAYERGFLEGSQEEMIALYEKSCAAKFEDGCQNLAIVYIREGSPENEARAVKLFEQSCQRGYSTACTDLADRLFTGRGVAEDRERAISLLEVECERDDPYGCAFLGKATFRSAASGDRKQQLRAIEILQKSCALESPRGCLWAGEYAEEIGDSLDDTTIEMLYQRAFALFDKDCRVARTGRSCGMCATMIRDHLEESPSGIEAKEYFALGCEYDVRVCDW
jgi:TPR repeat protein